MQRSEDMLGNVTFTTPAGRVFEWSPADRSVRRYPAQPPGAVDLHARVVGRADTEAEALAIVLAERAHVVGEVQASAVGQILGTWLRHRGLPVATLSGPMTPARLLASPDSLRPSERTWLQTFAAKHGENTEAK